MTTMTLQQIPAAQTEASLKAARFLRRHGPGLFDLLDILGHAEALDALSQLLGQSEEGLADLDLTRAALDRILAPIQRQSQRDLDQAAMTAQIDMPAALSWYGARLTDLRNAFPRDCARRA